MNKVSPFGTYVTKPRPRSLGTSSSRARRVQYSSTPCQESLIPIEISFLAISPLPCREIGFRVIAKLVGTFSCYSKPRNPMGLNVNALRSCRGFPYREIGTRDAAVHLHPKSPNLELRYAHALSPCHITFSLSLSLLFWESCDRDFKGRNPLALENPECRNPISPNFRHVSSSESMVQISSGNRDSRFFFSKVPRPRNL